jgi:lysophospholipase L1-like esterase
VDGLHSNVLNVRDVALQRRGYYEELDVAPMDNWQWRQTQAGKPDDWGKGLKVFYRQRSDFMLTDINPSVSTFFAGAPMRSNSLGMRDREYDPIKPPNTYRIVLLGASHDEGNGVTEDETYENIVEERLNRELPDSQYSRYEILNMSVGMSGLFQRLLRLEEQGFQFKPDAVILSVGAADKQFLFRHLRQTISLGIEPPPDYRQILEQVTRSASVRRGMPEVMIERRLRPYGDELYEWAFQRFAQQCRQRGIHPLVIFRPAPVDFQGEEQAGRRDVIRLARDAGLEVIDLSPAFDSITDRNTLTIAKWDDHTSALGHRLLADKLYDGLVPLLFGPSH